MIKDQAHNAALALWASYKNRFGASHAILKESYLDAPQPVATGIEPVDTLTNGGLRPGLHLVAGTPGAGKTSFTLFMAACMAAHGRRVLYVSLEMSRGQCYARLASMASLCDGLQPFRWSDWERMGRSARKAQESGKDITGDAGYAALCYVLDKWPGLCVVDSSGGCNETSTLYGVIDEAREHGCEAVFVDYLQHVKDDGAANEYERVSAVSDGLNRCGVCNGIPIVCVSSMGRSSYGRGDNLGAFKGSGSLEYDAVSAWTLDRGSEEDRRSGARQVICTPVKNRFGLFGKGCEVDLWFDAAHSSFEIG